MKRIKKWFIDNKEDILFTWGAAMTSITVLLILFTMMLVIITEDLVGVVEVKEQEITNLTYERNHYAILADDLQQTYEEVVPKGQYIQDIEYLESVILELRNQCELECGTYNNKEN